MPITYSYIVHKEKGHKGDSPVFKLISGFAKTYKNPLFMISLPGFISLAAKDIKSFSAKLLSIIPNAYFTSGMNGEGYLTSSLKRVDYINSFFNTLGVKAATKRDHSKMMFFFDYNQFVNCLKNNTPYLSSCVAVLIGSSNQNLSSYFCYSHYGEADVLLVKYNDLTNNAEEISAINENDYRALSLLEYIGDNINVCVSKEITNSNIVEMFVKEVFE